MTRWVGRRSRGLRLVSWKGRLWRAPLWRKSSSHSYGALKRSHFSKSHPLTSRTISNFWKAYSTRLSTFIFLRRGTQFWLKFRDLSSWARSYRTWSKTTTSRSCSPFSLSMSLRKSTTLQVLPWWGFSRRKRLPDASLKMSQKLSKSALKRLKIFQLKFKIAKKLLVIRKNTTMVWTFTSNRNRSIIFSVSKVIFEFFVGWDRSLLKTSIES